MLKISQVIIPTFSFSEFKKAYSARFLGILNGRISSVTDSIIFVHLPHFPILSFPTYLYHFIYDSRRHNVHVFPKYVEDSSNTLKNYPLSFEQVPPIKQYKGLFLHFETSFPTIQCTHS
jgi:hypothetical protein